MNISDLPDEKILEICQEMDLPRLNNFVRTSKRNYEICKEVLESRKLSSDQIKHRLVAGNEQLSFYRDFPDGKSIIDMELDPFNENIILITQRFYPRKLQLPPPIIAITDSGSWSDSRAGTLIYDDIQHEYDMDSTMANLPNLVDTIYRRGYKLVEYPSN